MRLSETRWCVGVGRVDGNDNSEAMTDFVQRVRFDCCFRCKCAIRTSSPCAQPTELTGFFLAAPLPQKVRGRAGTTSRSEPPLSHFARRAQVALKQQQLFAWIDWQRCLLGHAQTLHRLGLPCCSSRPPAEPTRPFSLTLPSW